VIELRCPDTGKLFGKLAAGPGAEVAYEVACRACRVQYAKRGMPMTVVLHVFDGEGSCTATFTQRAE